MPAVRITRVDRRGSAAYRDIRKVLDDQDELVTAAKRLEPLRY